MDQSLVLSPSSPIVTSLSSEGTAFSMFLKRVLNLCVTLTAIGLKTGSTSGPTPDDCMSSSPKVATCVRSHIMALLCNDSVAPVLRRRTEAIPGRGSTEKPPITTWDFR